MKIQFLDRAIYLRNMALITIKESQPPTPKTPNTPPATLSGPKSPSTKNISTDPIQSPIQAIQPSTLSNII